MTRSSLGQVLVKGPGGFECQVDIPANEATLSDILDELDYVSFDRTDFSYKVGSKKADEDTAVKDGDIVTICF